MMKILSRFRTASQGNVAVIFAISLVPVFGAVGAAVDYTRASLEQARIQSALDAASLTVARDSRRLSAAAMQETADKAFAGNYQSRTDTTMGPIAVTKDGNTIRLTVEAAVQTSIAAAVGFDRIPLRVVSQTSWNEPRIEIALVLDNTGSMGWSGKMAALKAAALDLVNELESTRVSTDQVKLAVVPFDTQVRIPTAFRNATWMRYDATGLAASLVTTQAAWAGCLTDRDQPHDTTDSAPTSTAAFYRGAKCASNSITTLQPLTTNFTLVRNTINAMQPAGNTNITIGLQMGHAVLSSGVPFQETGAQPDVLRYMILLTDGDNTQNRFTSNSGQIDARTTLGCNAVKAAGITLFTVRVIEGNETLLRNCATNPSMYFNVTSSGGIGDAFKAITSMIKRMRLSV
ncbi:vWA domain-containing protein [Phreatobacter sp.]|uniref:vWA domain-containing protein n=1 Tax=Phreatobacter sp. TaxID=1966341 RepID=UPI003F6FFD33